LSKASTNMMNIVIVASYCHHIELPLPAYHVACCIGCLSSTSQL
jgi:hypothetical protein